MQAQQPDDVGAVGVEVLTFAGAVQAHLGSALGRPVIADVGRAAPPAAFCAHRLAEMERRDPT